MLARGIDQIQRQSCPPQLHESFVKDARIYVQLAEEKNGAVTQPVDSSYVWGAALSEFEQQQPDLKLINLETAVTLCDDFCPKGINYRMHPKNIGILSSAKINGCVLGNNHVLDWGRTGLSETLDTLHKAEIKFAGAGKDKVEASKPMLFNFPGKGRVLVFSYGMPSSGVVPGWEATSTSSGVNILKDLSHLSVEMIRDRIQAVKQPNDIVILSVHWGGNWGYKISQEEINFAHSLIDDAGVDVVHGHSSHHPKCIEVYKHKLILYGCGDFINDYEGISGHDQFRGELSLMYFVTLSFRTGNLLRLDLTPTQMKKLQVQFASSQDAQWLVNLLNRESRNAKFSLSSGRIHLQTQ